MKRRRKNQHSLLAVVASVLVFTGAGLLGRWSKPEISVYDNWPVSSEGYMMTISNDVDLPEAVTNWLPTATAKRIQDLDDIVPDTFRAAALDFLDTAVSTTARPGTTPTIDRESLRLSSTFTRTQSDLDTPRSRPLPLTQFASSTENPYLKTD